MRASNRQHKQLVLWYQVTILAFVEEVSSTGPPATTRSHLPESKAEVGSHIPEVPCLLVHPSNLHSQEDPRETVSNQCVPQQGT